MFDDHGISSHNKQLNQKQINILHVSHCFYSFSFKKGFMPQN